MQLFVVMINSDDSTSTGDNSDIITKTNDLILKILVITQQRLSSNYANMLVS